MNTKIVTALMLSAILALPGCKSLIGQEGYLRDREDDYLKSSRSERMRVPEGKQTPAIDDLLVIPPVEKAGRPAEFTVPRPDVLGKQSREQVSVQTLGDRTWLLVESAPSEVWPAMREFWEVNGVELAYESAARGLMETVWLSGRGENSADLYRQLFSQFPGGKSGENLDKFRVRLEHGVRMGTTELHLRHKSAAAGSQVAAAGSVSWPEASDHPGLESGMLQEMQVHLARGANRARSVSLLAQSLVGKPKAVYSRDVNGNPLLTLSLDFNRAWAAVGQALQDARLQVRDVNRSSATYYVGFGEIEDEEGLLSRILPGGDEPATEAEIAARQLAEAHRMRLEQQPDGGVVVRVYDASGALAEPVVSESLLSMVKEHIS